MKVHHPYGHDRRGQRGDLAGRVFQHRDFRRPAKSTSSYSSKRVTISVASADPGHTIAATQQFKQPSQSVREGHTPKSTSSLTYQWTVPTFRAARRRHAADRVPVPLHGRPPLFRPNGQLADLTKGGQGARTTKLKPGRDRRGHRLEGPQQHRRGADRCPTAGAALHPRALRPVPDSTLTEPAPDYLGLGHGVPNAYRPETARGRAYAAMGKDPTPPAGILTRSPSRSRALEIGSGKPMPS